MKDLKEFKINDLITLKFENEITQIYVRNEIFDQCKHLLFEINENIEGDYTDINSIDEAEEKLKKWSKSNIPPKDEFWGHCSNLQVWVENKYDTKLLHRSLAFPLLKKLTQLGDPIAKRVFKEEIATRFASAHPSVVEFLIMGDFLDYMNSEELELLITELFSLRFIFALRELVRRSYTKMKKYITGLNYENLLLNLYREVNNSNNSKLKIICWNTIQEIIGIELTNRFPVDKDKYILWFKKENNVNRITTLRLSGEIINQEKTIIDKVFGWKLLGGLKRLWLKNFEMLDCSFLENLYELEEIKFFSCDIKEIEGIKNLKKLKSFECINCSFPKYYDFTSNRNLTKITLYRCGIEEIMGLEGLDILKVLDLSYNKISEIRGLDNLTNLMELNLESNLIQRIEGLEKLNNLVKVDISSNEISRIENLDHLKELKILYLAHNNISTIENLESLIGIEELSLNNNRIRSAENLSKIKSLRIVNLNGNPLSNDNIK